jgi:hypothetical protein
MACLANSPEAPHNDLVSQLRSSCQGVCTCDERVANAKAELDQVRRGIQHGPSVERRLSALGLKEAEQAWLDEIEKRRTCPLRSP